jgi:hypothetical protein
MILNVAHTPPDTADVPLLPALPAQAGGEDSKAIDTAPVPQSDD